MPSRPPSSLRITLSLSLLAPASVLAQENVMRAQDNVMRPPSAPTTSTTSPVPAPSTATTSTAPTPQFIALDRFDFRLLLSPPPAADSLAAQVDLETVLQVQASRTPEQVAWAKRVERDNVFFHADVLGPWFTAEQLPVTAAFFRRLAADMRLLDGAAKKPFLRPRPTTVDPRVKPCVELPTSTSYPSGSAMQAFVWAELLADALPAHRAALLDRASRAAWGRVIGGVHFPSDVVAGRQLAAAYLAEARKHPEFIEAFTPVRTEITRASTAATSR